MTRLTHRVETRLDFQTVEHCYHNKTKINIGFEYKVCYVPFSEFIPTLARALRRGPAVGTQPGVVGSTGSAEVWVVGQSRSFVFCSLDLRPTFLKSRPEGVRTRALYQCTVRRREGERVRGWEGERLHVVTSRAGGSGSTDNNRGGSQWMSHLMLKRNI